MYRKIISIKMNEKMERNLNHLLGDWKNVMKKKRKQKLTERRS